MHFDALGKVKTGWEFDNTCQSTFFDIQFWKKGTIHISFRCEKTWQDFNLRDAQGKKWLPEAP